MLAAAGLGATWLFRKARILAIFDDLDTVLLMIPLKVLLVGIAWQLGMVVVVMAVMLAVAYIWLHRITIPVTWPWVIAYGAIIVGVTEGLHAGSAIFDPSVPIHIEVLLPAFVLGCIARRRSPTGASDSATDDAVVEADLHEVLERPTEKRASLWVSAGFMLVVGLSMPQIFDGEDAQHPTPSPAALHAAGTGDDVDDPTALGGEEEGKYTATVTGRQPSMGWGEIALHVIVLSVISNIGKMFPAFCYRREAHWRHRLALAIGMWPRGEVGAGVLVLSLSYGIGGPIVKRLIDGIPEKPAAITDTDTEAATPPTSPERQPA